MKDEYMKEILIKIVISAVIFAFLVGGICIYMFKPEESDELENDESESSGEIVEIVDDEINDENDVEIENELVEDEENVDNEISNQTKTIDFDQLLNGITN